MKHKKFLHKGLESGQKAEQREQHQEEEKNTSEKEAKRPSC